MTKSTGVGRGKGGGPPTKYDAKFVKITAAMAKLGATEREIAQAIGVSDTTFKRWLHEHPKLRAAVKPGKVPSDDRVERSLFQRATGYSYDSEKIFTYDYVESIKRGEDEVVLVKEKRVLRVPVVEHVPPESTAAIFWLKNRRKDTWRDFKATELSTPPGRPLEFATQPGEPDLIGAYYARLGGAAPAPSSPSRADPSADPGVGEGGQGAKGQSSRKAPGKG